MSSLFYAERQRPDIVRYYLYLQFYIYMYLGYANCFDISILNLNYEMKKSQRLRVCDLFGNCFKMLEWVILIPNGLNLTFFRSVLDD